MKFRENLEIRDTEFNQIKIELEITKKSSENQDDLDKIKFELEETRQKLKTLENSESLLEQVKLFDLFKKCIKSKYFWNTIRNIMGPIFDSSSPLNFKNYQNFF